MTTADLLEAVHKADILMQPWALYCRWATDKEQNNNTRNNRVVEYQGKQYTVSQLAEFAGLSVSAIFQRIYKGWDINDVVQKPLRERKRGYRPSKAYNCEVPG